MGAVWNRRSRSAAQDPGEGILTADDADRELSLEIGNFG
jgi:hypothetical protein